MRLISICLTALLLAGLTAIYNYEIVLQPIPEPVVEEVEPEPKQSPYVVYVFVCGELEAVIVTSEPYMSVDIYNGGDPTDEMLEFMLEAERTNRILTFSGGFRFCSSAQPEYHD